MRLSPITEHAEQKAVCDWWRVACRAYKLPEFTLYAVPNAAKRSFKLAAMLKAEGMRKGIPDLHLDVPRNGFHGLKVEMKIKPNKPSAEQLEVGNYLTEAGYQFRFCFSSFEAISVIKNYLGDK